MSDEQRLARDQGQLVAALVAGGPLPEGLDRDGAHALAAILAAKRRRALRRAAPDILVSLGSRFDPLFDRFVRVVPLGARADGLDDALAFLAWVDADGSVPSPAWPLRLRLRWERARRRLRPGLR